MELERSPTKSPARGLLTSLTFWLVVAAVAGALVGHAAPQFSHDASPMAQLFLRPMEFTVLPLVFSSIVALVAEGVGPLRQLGRLAFKSFVYFEIVTTLALALGLISANLIKPGESSRQTTTHYTPKTTTFTLATWIDALASKTWGDMMGGFGSLPILQVLVAAILVGVSTALLADSRHRRQIIGFAHAVLGLTFQMIDLVMWAAPVGSFFAVAAAVATNGFSAISSMATLVATVYGSLAVFVLVVFVPIMFFFRIPPIEFLVAMREPLIIAYTTAMPDIALPKAIEALDAYGVSLRISAFVVPFGYSLDAVGPALFLSLASVFCAQAAGVEQSAGEQVVMMLMLMVSSKGVTATRSGTLVVLAATLSMFDIPSWPLTLIMGADWFMDMVRTLLTVFGNCLAATVMAKMENEFRGEEWEQRALHANGRDDSKCGEY